jgi:hypothetical protein
MNSQHDSSTTVRSISKLVVPAVLALLAMTVTSSIEAQTFQTALTEQEFVLAPSGKQTFVLPVAYIPVHITVSFSLENGGTQTPSELMYAVVNWDQKSDQLTWIATSSDGVTSASTTLSGSSIANIGGGNVTLSVASLAGHTLEIAQSAARTAIDGHYVLTMSY